MHPRNRAFFRAWNVVAEAHDSNVRAIEILNAINNKELVADCYNEKREAVRYGAGCIQKFGVTTIRTKDRKYLYAAGTDAEGTEFVKWQSLPDLQIEGKLFSSTDIMKGFFDYEWNCNDLNFEKPVVFVANYKAIQGSNIKEFNNKTVLASGIKTWFELAKKGYWVTASADAFGFEFLLTSLDMPLLNITNDDITILTHESAAKRWRDKGYDAISRYKQVSKNDVTIQRSIADADAIFWTSYSQYQFYGKHAKQDVKHLCAGGETAELLKQTGIEPVIFPTIKAFEQWRKYSIHSHSVA